MDGAARFAVSGSDDWTVRVWDLATGDCTRVLGGRFLQNLRGHTGEITSVSLGADERTVVTGSVDKTVRAWDLYKSRCARTRRGHGSRVASVALSRDGRFVLSAGYDTVRLWDVKTGRCLHELDHPDARAVGLSGNGHVAVSGGRDRTARVWQLDPELTAHEAADWDPGARPFLAAFLTAHTPVGATGDRAGTPTWSDQDVAGLLTDLQHAGYGRLRPEGVNAELDRMASSWRRPPPLPGR